MEKRSGSHIRQPGFSQTKRSQSEDRESYGGRSTMGSSIGRQSKAMRSQSEDRESYGGRSVSSITRPSTVGMLPGRSLGAMTPVTPSQGVNVNLPTGSTRPTR